MKNKKFDGSFFEKQRSSKKEKMESITLSKRMYVIFKRIIETKLDKAIEAVKKVKKNSNMPLYYELLNKKWMFKIACDIGFHEDGCNEEDLLYGETCDDCNYKGMEITVSICTFTKDKDFGSEIIIEEMSAPADKITKEQVIEWLDWVEKNKNAWKLCMCGEVATMNTACDKCYIHGYVRTEEEGGDCCVCHENDGRWLKQVCGHTLHYHCYLKIPMEKDRGNNVGRKCPLCRNVSAFSTTIDDCYDV